MQLLDHVSITVRDLERARGFYDAVMAVLGAEKVYDRPDAVGDAGAPGLRPNYHPAYFAAFLEDPEGNRVEAVCHSGDEHERR
jgi:catechol 2,3-dioxygenase-like lactoylglutathione lyase family enzyme